jgi:hypothetical protein
MQTITADVHQPPSRMKSQPVAMTLYRFIDGSGANESYHKTEEASQQISQPAEEDALR